MYFYKIQHPNNFTFAHSLAEGSLDFGFMQAGFNLHDYGEECFHLQFTAERWAERKGLNTLTPPQGAAPSSCTVAVDEAGVLSVINAAGQPVLQPGPMGSIGLCGTRWLYEFAYDDSLCFYGMGEKTGPLEKTGKADQVLEYRRLCGFYLGSM